MARFDEFYYCNACHSCKAIGGRLLACGACRSYRYCSRECQFAHRPSHRRMCGGLAKLGGAERADRLAVKRAAEDALARPLTPAENQVWMFPRRCATCGSSDSLYDCKHCPGASFCSKRHEIESKHGRNACNKLRIQYEYYVRLMKGPPLYPDVDPNSTLEDLRSNVFDKTDRESCNPSIVSLSEKLGHVCTVLNALDITKVVLEDSLICHVVGATHEYDQFDRQTCEFLFHQKPNLKSILLTFVGPELVPMHGDEWEFCSDCRQAEKTVRHEFKVTVYSEYFASEDYKHPNMIAVFNCGFHEFADTNSDPWQNSLPLLLSPNVTLLTTSYTLDEAVRDMNVLKMYFVKDARYTVYACCEPNKFKSCLPLRDWTDDTQFYYKNNYFSLIKRIE